MSNELNVKRWLDCRIPGPLNVLLKSCHRSPAVRSPQWLSTENDIHINKSVPKPGILQSLLSLHFAVRLTTRFTRSCEEESTRLLIKPKRSFQCLGLSTLTPYFSFHVAVRYVNCTFQEVVLSLNNFHSSTTGLRTAVAVFFSRTFSGPGIRLQSLQGAER